MIIYDYIWLYLIIYAYIWLYMIIYEYMWLYVIIYDYIWLYMIIYDYIWLYMIIYDYIWLYMIIYDYMYIYIHDYIYDYIWLYMIIYDYIWLYMIIYDYIWWLYMIIYDHIWLYMIIYDHIWLYLIIYDYIWLYVHIYIYMYVWLNADLMQFNQETYRIQMIQPWNHGDFSTSRCRNLTIKQMMYWIRYGDSNIKHIHELWFNHLNQKHMGLNGLCVWKYFHSERGQLSEWNILWLFSTATTHLGIWHDLANRTWDWPTWSLNLFESLFSGLCGCVSLRCRTLVRLPELFWRDSELKHDMSNLFWNITSQTP